jgi:hypothetical protein
MAKGDDAVNSVRPSRIGLHSHIPFKNPSFGFASSSLLYWRALLRASGDPGFVFLAVPPLVN